VVEQTLFNGTKKPFLIFLIHIKKRVTALFYKRFLALILQLGMNVFFSRDRKNLQR